MGNYVDGECVWLGLVCCLVSFVSSNMIRMGRPLKSGEGVGYNVFYV